MSGRRIRLSSNIFLDITPVFREYTESLRMINSYAKSHFKISVIELMSISEDKKNKIRKFYSDEILQHVCHVSDSFNEFMQDSHIGWLRIHWDEEEGGLLEPYIRRLANDNPDNLLRTFERHLWYSRHNLTDISVLKKSVDGDETFLVLLQGHCNDGWDNGCRLIEVFDYQGESRGSGFFRVGGWDGGVLQQWIDWVDRQLNGNDYWMSAPPYPDDPELNGEQSNVLRRYELIWSEDGSDFSL